MKTPLIALAAFATAMTGAPALAEEQTESMVVQYDDLDLTSEAGQATLEFRIDSAAKKFCRVDAIQTGSRVKNRTATKCYKEAKRLATRQFAQVVEEARMGG
ncbi:UrcA family protein [Parerythrobacter aestuarii]|uniref:UrcA family protein n=1 Tax=Parerythrobacter aestuarii TaxID=3020909 RepID=UPI0024DE6516|nr:UrcA family protein [Parerythrobacter aestuarii]